MITSPALRWPPATSGSCHQVSTGRPSYCCTWKSAARVPCGRERLEPHEAPVFIEDHRPVLSRAGIGREEQIARRGPGEVGRDGDGGRLKARGASESSGSRRGAAPGRGVPPASPPLSRTATVKLHAKGIALGAFLERGLDAHALALRERLRGHEARPVAL